MGFKLTAQLVLIIAAVVLIFSYIQPSLTLMKGKQDELFQYQQAVAKASEFNARLRELIAIRDSFSQSDIRSLEKFVPTEIDKLKLMSEISGIFTSRNIEIRQMVAHDSVDPQGEIAFESGIVVQQGAAHDLSYQDFEVMFTGTYTELRDVLMLTEASDSLLEVVELAFDTTAGEAQVDDNGNPLPRTSNGEYAFRIVFRTYGLPIETSE